MLDEIKCDRFTDAIPGKTIAFHPGLNTVIGGDDGENSVGKSTLLLLIDACFGGTTYFDKDADIVTNVGQHEIYFSFSFADGKRRFCRSTLDPKTYWECDQDYNKIGEPRKIEQLSKYLNEHYFRGDENVSFRDVVGRFSRISERDTYDVNQPLIAYKGDLDSAKGIDVLEILFGVFDAVKSIKGELQEAKEKKNTFLAAKRYSFLDASISSKSQIENAKREILKTQGELEELVKSKNQTIDLQDAEISPETIDLKSQLLVLVRKKASLESKLKKIGNLEGGSSLMNENDLQELKSYFPNVDFKKLETINEFQRGLITNVSETIETEKSNISRQLSILDEQIAPIKELLAQSNISSSVSPAFMNQCYEKQEQIRKLKEQIALYEKERQFREEIKIKEAAVIEAEKNGITTIEKTTNNELERMNDTLYSEKRYPPLLQIDSYKKYTLITPGDHGDGSQHKSLIAFDLALLKLTSLPFVIHDSLLFSDIWNEPLENLFRIYLSSEKQEFIAIDRIKRFGNYWEGALTNAQVVKLGSGTNSLFGKIWALKK